MKHNYLLYFNTKLVVLLYSLLFFSHAIESGLCFVVFNDVANILKWYFISNVWVVVVVLIMPLGIT